MSEKPDAGVGIKEVEYVEGCPSCGQRFIGMSPEEFRETHAEVDCPYAPLPTIVGFPTESERQERSE